MTLRVDSILSKLTPPPIEGQASQSILDLLALYDQHEYDAEWDADPQGPRLYRWFAEKLIAEGHPTPALNLARRGLEREASRMGKTGRLPTAEAEGDPSLRYLVALAFARGGNPASADRYAAPLVQQVLSKGWTAPTGVNGSELAGSALALAGRLLKDRIRETSGEADRKDLARRAAEWYLKAAEFMPDDAFPVGNAATLHFVAGDAAKAEQLAAKAYELALAQTSPATYWPEASAGEACLVLGREDEALPRYEIAASRMLQARDRGALAALLPNIRLLVAAGMSFDPAWITKHIGGVVVFSGHRIDPPWFGGEDGRPARFPNDPILIDTLKVQIAAELERLNARFGFCSLACGSDILFAEAMLERRGDLQVVLPFAERDFLRLSVDYGLSEPIWAAWAERYRSVLDRLSRDQDAKYFATNEPHLGSDELFGYANEVLQGITIVRARQLSVDPVALVVLDPVSPPTPGGAAHFKEIWGRTGYKAHIVNLADLRNDVTHGSGSASPAPSPPPALRRQVRAMLFADVAGFSRMTEELAPEFFRLFPQMVADSLAAAGDRLLLKNTWGDGVFAVFGADEIVEGGGEAALSGVVEAANAALRLVTAFMTAEQEWKRMGFTDPNPIRVALHAGPVFELSPDPVLGRTNYFGQHVNRTARIEPITIPGSVYASEQFAALLTVAAPREFSCEFVGVEPLAKDYATAPLYQVRRSLAADSAPAHPVWRHPLHGCNNDLLPGKQGQPV